MRVAAAPQMMPEQPNAATSPTRRSKKLPIAAKGPVAAWPDASPPIAPTNGIDRKKRSSSSSVATRRLRHSTSATAIARANAANETSRSLGAGSRSRSHVDVGAPRSRLPPAAPRRSPSTFATATAASLQKRHDYVASRALQRSNSQTERRDSTTTTKKRRKSKASRPPAPPLREKANSFAAGIILSGRADIPGLLRDADPFPEDEDTFEPDGEEPRRHRSDAIRPYIGTEWTSRDVAVATAVARMSRESTAAHSARDTVGSSRDAAAAVAALRAIRVASARLPPAAPNGDSMAHWAKVANLADSSTNTTPPAESRDQPFPKPKVKDLNIVDSARSGSVAVATTPATPTAAAAPVAMDGDALRPPSPSADELSDMSAEEELNVEAHPEMRRTKRLVFGRATTVDIGGLSRLDTDDSSHSVGDEKPKDASATTTAPSSRTPSERFLWNALFVEPPLHRPLLSGDESRPDDDTFDDDDDDDEDEEADIRIVLEADGRVVQLRERPLQKRRRASSAALDWKMADEADVVQLNVGGARFTTTKSTLTSRDPDSFFAQLFQMEDLNDLPEPWRSACCRLDPNGFFVDRDGELFAYVLDYLRNGKLLLPEQFKELARLREETLFYQLEGMHQQLIPHLSVRYPTKNGSYMNGLSNALETGGFITLGYRGTFAFGRDGQADVKFRKLHRILVCGKAQLCREVFGETLNESRDPDREGSERYTSRLYLKHQCLERACDNLAEKGFKLVTACSSGANGLAAPNSMSSNTVSQPMPMDRSRSTLGILGAALTGQTKGDEPKEYMTQRNSGDFEEQRWAHYTEYVFYREPQVYPPSSPLSTSPRTA